jgi:dCMP deaminase
MKQSTFLKIADLLSEESKCVSMKVGAVIVKDQRVISMVYNGTPAGTQNCSDLFHGKCEEHHQWSLDHEIHAEMNALMFAAKNGISVDGAELYCNYSPCRNCLKHIKQAGISAVYFWDIYYRYTEEDLAKLFKYCSEIGIKYIQVR